MAIFTKDSQRNSIFSDKLKTTNFNKTIRRDWLISVATEEMIKNFWMTKDQYCDDDIWQHSTRRLPL